MWGEQTRVPEAQALIKPTELGGSRAEPKPGLTGSNACSCLHCPSPLQPPLRGKVGV